MSPNVLSTRDQSSSHSIRELTSGMISTLVNLLKVAYSSKTWLIEYLKRIDIGRLLNLAECVLLYLSRLLFGSQRNTSKVSKCSLSQTRGVTTKHSNANRQKYIQSFQGPVLSRLHADQCLRCYLLCLRQRKNPKSQFFWHGELKYHFTWVGRKAGLMQNLWCLILKV